MEFILLWCFVFAYFAQRGAEDLVHAVKGTPNPRYELKKMKALAAGLPAPQQPRYGSKDWFDDLLTDALAANTEKRRVKAKAKALPVDDMVELTREPRPASTPTVREPAPRLDVEDEPSRGVVHDGGSASYTKATGSKWAWSCRRAGCPAKGFDLDSEELAKAGAVAHRCKDTQSAPREGVQILGGPRPTTPPPAAPAAPTKPTPSTNGTRPVLRLVLPTETQGDNMQTSAETTHIQATRRYFTDLDEHVKTQILPGLEQCASILAGKNMDTEVIGKIHNARALFMNALAGLADALKTHDEKNKLMEEGVNNTEQPAEVGYYKHQ